MSQYMIFSGPSTNLVKSGPRKGKLSRGDMKWRKDTIKAVRKDRKDQGTNPGGSRKSGFVMSPRVGKPANYIKPKSSYKKSGVGKR